MMSGGKDIINDTCKTHMNRSEKDLYRVCPSKLNKRELEDLYFALFESSIQLKKTLNEQQDEIKILTTKVQRLTAQKPVRNYNKDCCAKSMAVINEQKESIADLKRVNERLTDRLRLLNIKLCSTKQYLRRSPAQSSTRCSKCSLAFNAPVKNSSMSALYIKRSETNLRTASTSCEFLDKENTPVKLTEIVSTQTENKLQDNCEQNKCQTTIDELKQKITNLEEELNKTHEKYSEKLNKLDNDVSLLRTENIHLQAERAAGEQKLLTQQQQLKNVLEKLREAEEKCDDLTAQLMMEKGKVSELEMLLKAADISSQVAKTLQKQLKNSIVLVPNNSATSVHSASFTVTNHNDSGYTETNKSQDNKKESELDQNIIDQIATLKVELDSLKLSLRNDNKDVLKLTPSNAASPDKLNMGASVVATDSVSVSHVETTADVHTIPSQAHVLTSTGKTNPNVESVCDGLTNGSNDQTQTEKPVNISGIPTLNKNVKNAIKSMKTDRLNRKDSDDTENDKTKHDSDNSNGITHNIYNIVKNNKEDKTKDGYENTTSRTSLNSHAKFSKNDSIDTDSETANSNSSQIAQKGQIIEDVANINDLNINKSSTIINKISENEGIEPYFNSNKVEPPKSKDLATVTSADRKDKSKVKRNEKKHKDSVEQKNKASKVKRRMSYDVETKLNKEKLTKASSDDNIGSKTYSIEPKKPLATSSPNQGTYIIKDSVGTRASSPDNTECEISSLTDLPHEMDDKTPFDYISPGEERATPSSSFATTDYGSLSEGEIPAGRRSSYTETTESIRREASNTQDTLKAISDEVSRCRRLLRAQVSFPDITIPSYPYNTLTLN